jgi:hypothetical protein
LLAAKCVCGRFNIEAYLTDGSGCSTTRLQSDNARRGFQANVSPIGTSSPIRHFRLKPFVAGLTCMMTARPSPVMQRTGSGHPSYSSFGSQPSIHVMRTRGLHEGHKLVVASSHGVIIAIGKVAARPSAIALATVLDQRDLCWQRKHGLSSFMQQYAARAKMPCIIASLCECLARRLYMARCGLCPARNDVLHISLRCC